MDRGFFLTLHAIRRQLTAMPNEVYPIRSIHSVTRICCPAERLWTAGELSMGGVVHFLRRRNSQACDVYLQPFGGDQNSGYILLDLDSAQPGD